jgi:hypothetical protein
MYKKITHHIVEEHFDHPIATELKAKIEKKSKATIDYMGRVIDPLTGKPAIDPRTGEFVYADTNISKAKLNSSKKSNTKPKSWIEIYDYIPLNLIEKRSINRWACLNNRIRNLVVSITQGENTITDLLKSKITDDITKISELLVECYGEDAAKTFRKLLTNVVLSLSEVLMLVKADKDTTQAMTTLADANKALGDFTEAANSAWPSKAVVDIFTQVENLYIMQAISRIKKEWAAEVDAADSAYNIMVVGQDNGSPSFADIFSAGILSCMETTIENAISENIDYMET